MIRKLALALVLLASLAAGLAWFSCSRHQADVAISLDEMLAAADDLKSRGKCDKAILMYEKVLSGFPRPQVAEAAKYNMATCLMDEEQYDLAATEFRDFVDVYPKSDLVDNAMYLAARCSLNEAPRIERDQAETAEALGEFNLLLRKYPDTDVRKEVEDGIREARSRLAEKEYANGQLYYRLGDYRSAQIYFEQVISEYGDTAWAEEALLAKGLALERQGMPDDARRAYEQVIRDAPAGSSGQEAARRLKRLGGAGDVKSGTDSAE